MGGVLIVDDSVDTCEVLVRLFRATGHAAEAVYRGEDALARLTDPARERPALVLLDVMMPGVSGLEVLGRVREDPRWRDLPVILFSAVCHGPLIERAGPLGVQDFIFKGTVGSWDLLGRVAKYLKHHPPRPRPEASAVQPRHLHGGTGRPN